MYKKACLPSVTCWDSPSQSGFCLFSCTPSSVASLISLPFFIFTLFSSLPSFFSASFPFLPNVFSVPHSSAFFPSSSSVLDTSLNPLREHLKARSKVEGVASQLSVVWRQYSKMYSRVRGVAVDSPSEASHYSAHSGRPFHTTSNQVHRTIFRCGERKPKNYGSNTALLHCKSIPHKVLNQAILTNVTA